jgi:hypothetical protein
MLKPLSDKNSEERILFRRLRDMAVRNSVKSEEFKKFVRSQKEGSEFHHVFGSIGAKKSTDYLGVALTAEEHKKAHYDNDFLIELMPEAIENILKYVQKLEKENRELKCR